MEDNTPPQPLLLLGGGAFSFQDACFRGESGVLRVAREMNLVSLAGESGYAENMCKSNTHE